MRAVDVAQAGSRAVTSTVNSAVDGTQRAARSVLDAGNSVVDRAQDRFHQGWDWLHG